MGYLVGIGGANMDIHCRGDYSLKMRDSNPGTIHFSMGGVCRNICENLSRLGESVYLITAVGNDSNGRTIMEECRQAGINMDSSVMIDDQRTSMYVSILDQLGDMFVAMSDMHIIKHLDERIIINSHRLISHADIIICDGNLSQKAIRHLTTHYSVPLYLDPVSAAWAKEIKPFIGAFDTVKPNRIELEILSGITCNTIEDMQLACDILRGQGVRRVFVSLGSEGMFYRGPEGTVMKKSRPVSNIANSTGAGDAAMAGLIWATRNGWCADDIVCASMASGIIAILSQDTINQNICPELIDKVIKEFIL